MNATETGAVTGAVPVRVGLGRIWPFLVAVLLAAVDLGLIKLRLHYNTGVSFSLGADLPVWGVAGVTGALVFRIAAYLWKTTKTGQAPPLLGISLVLGGALGNFVDRMDGRGVVDYLHSGWFHTFNLADVWVTLGVMLIVLASFTRAKDHPS